MIEALQIIESPTTGELPAPLEIVPGMEDTHQGMLTFAETASEHLLNQYDGKNTPAILVPLNGGIIPSIYLINGLKQQMLTGNISPEELDVITRQFRFTEYQGNTLHATGAPIQDCQPINVIDDIADNLHLAEKLLKVFPSITLLSPCQKEHTPALAKQIPGLTLLAGFPVRNRWIISGYGMDPGDGEVRHEDGSFVSDDERDFLSALCRCSRIGLYNPKVDGAIPPYEQIIPALERHCLEWTRNGGEESTDIFSKVKVLDAAKKRRDYIAQLTLSQECLAIAASDRFLNGQSLSDFT